MRPDMAVLSWLHFGDLHITGANEQNHRDLLALIDVANRHLRLGVDFAVLPGDNADQGTAAQFRLVREAIDGLQLPVHVLPGDHDFHSGTLNHFHDVLGAERLPEAVSAKGCRCLFLDVVSHGRGGPDFRLDGPQLDWMRRELESARGVGETAAVFMHAYPADLRAGATSVSELLRDYRVACVDMGHTHYNELANDGRTVFMTTRSTGQIEEGPVGFSLAAIDAGVVSWRFQPLDGTWPLVMVTSPADHRLIVDPGASAQVVRDDIRIAAKVWGERPAVHVLAAIDGGDWFGLNLDEDDGALWRGVSRGTLSDGLHQLTVRAEEDGGRSGSETIVFEVSRDERRGHPARHADGSDRDAIGAWPEKQILGTQLGPNRNGRKW